MHPWRFCFLAGALSLAACSTPSNSFEAAYNAHAARYADEMRAAVQDYQAGRISDAEMQTRLRAAAEALTAADAATGRDEESVLAAYPQPNPPAAKPAEAAAAPPQASPPPPPALRPATSNDDDCLLISCPKGLPPGKNP